MTALLDPPVAPAAPASEPHRRPAPERAGLAALLLGTAVTYLWSLSASGWANSFYSAAVQAGSVSWKAFLFGSLDSGNAITVDKPPASLWVMDLSVRVFGLSSWTILVPEALMGVATVWLTYLAVRRAAGVPAAFVAGVATALTPSAALMFRFNNPDALLLLLLVAAGYATLRAAEAARGRWLALAGVLVGFAFLTKMLQAFLVLPAFVLVYLVAAPTSLGRRVRHLLVAFGAMIASAGWWICVVELWPAADRPYIDGSTDNDILELVLGYNGLGRLTGSETGGLGNAGFSSDAGILRLFGGVSGGMISWLLPAALVVLVGGLVALRRAPRTDTARAALLLSGVSMLVTGLTFSFMAGIYHDYYTVALAPWIAMTAVIGSMVLWRARSESWARVVLAVAVAGSAAWAFVLLGQAGENPYDVLRWPVILLGFGAAALLLVVDRLDRRTAVGLVLAAVLTTSIGPAAYTLETVGTAHTGSIVTAGPVSGMGGMGGMAGGARPPVMGGRTFAGGMGGGMFGGQSVSNELTAALQQDAASYTWVAATVRSSDAASYQLASREPVMAIGGFNGTASSPTLAQFQQDVAEGRIHYFIASGNAGGMGGPGASADSVAAQITAWVESSFTPTTIGGTTVYDLTSTSSTSTGTAQNA
ncbi:MAG TPA: glycosyltransferase family 39 protein [Nocardioides sp.]|nr:glycosyltransferase family 39 protein [Nocardioides sp.]